MTSQMVTKHFQAAQEARQKGNLVLARQSLEMALQLDPQNAGIHNALGNLELDARNFQKAADHYRSAIAADAKAPVLWLNLARAMREGGDALGEKEALDAALALDQRNFLARVRRAEWFDRHDQAADGFLDWSGILQMLSSADAEDPAIADVLSKAKGAVEAFMAQFSAVVDPAMQEASEGLGYEEVRRVNAFVDTALGRRRIYRNECAGLMYPMLPADEFFPRSHFPWMDFFEEKIPAIRNELEALLRDQDGSFRPYVSMAPGTPENKWSPLNNSKSWNAGYLWKYGQPCSDVLEHCPETAMALSQVEDRFDAPGRGPTAFFSLLQPHSHIPPHTGVSNLRAIIHVPLIVPAGCWFRVGGETRVWEEGKIFAFDDTIEHEARNESDALRGILIFDVWNPHILPHERDLIRQFFKSAEAAGMPNESQFDI